MLDFITIGGATRDIFFRVERAQKKMAHKSLGQDTLVLPYGEKLVADETFYAYGGGAANSAVCLARLGAKVAAMCNVGREGTGSLIVKALDGEGVVTSLVQRDKSLHTGLSIFILGKDSEHTGLLERGANSMLRFLPKGKKSKFIYLSSLTGEAAKNLPQIFDYAKLNNIKIIFNPGSQQLSLGGQKLSRYIAQANVLILNKDEAESLAKSLSKRPKNNRNLIKTIADLGAKITVITDGENGSHAICEDVIYSQPAFPKKIIDTTGAGDCFGATFAYAISRGSDVRYALKIAAINSASVVSFMGAQKGLLKKNKIKELV